MNELDEIPYELVDDEGQPLINNLIDFDIQKLHLVPKIHFLSIFKKKHKYIQSFTQKESAFVAALTLAFIQYGKKNGFILTISNIVHESLLEPNWGMSNTFPLEIYWHRNGDYSSPKTFTSNRNHYILNRFHHIEKENKKSKLNIFQYTIFLILIILITLFCFYYLYIYLFDTLGD